MQRNTVLPSGRTVGLQIRSRSTGWLTTYSLKQRAFRLRVTAISSWTRITPKAKTGALLSALYETACSLLTFSIFTNNYPEETRPVFLGRAATAGTYQCLWNSKWKLIRWKGLMTFVPAISFTEHVLQWCPLVLETPQKIWLWTTVPKPTQMTPPKTKLYTGTTQLQNGAVSLISCTGTAAVRQNGAISLISCTGTAAVRQNGAISLISCTGTAAVRTAEWSNFSDQLYWHCSSACKDGESNLFQLPEQTALQDAG